MKKGMIVGIVAVVVLAGVIVALMTHNGKKAAISPAANNMSNMDMSNSQNSSSSKPIATTAVSIQSFAFTPSVIMVKAGSTVTWTNNDSTAHTVTVDSGDGPKSDNIQPGGTYTFTFNTAGTFNYHCSIHASMTGSVIVNS